MPELLHINYQLLSINQLNIINMKQIENNQNGQPRFQFNAKLLAIGTTEQTNTNGKKFKVVTIEFVALDGKTYQETAMIFEGNYSLGIEVGKTYLTTATIVGERAYLQMSHLLAGSGNVAASLFFSESATETPASVTAGEIAS